METPQLGDRVREIVTHREGVVTGYCEYLWGCEQYLVHIDSERDKDGDPKTVWYDVGRLEVLEVGAVAAFEYLREPEVEPPKARRPFFRRSARPRLAFSGPDTPAPIR